MGWNGPEQLGGQLWSDIKVVSWDVNRLDAFAIGRWPDNTSLMHKWWDGWAWGGWHSLGGSYSPFLDVVSCRPNRLDIFGLGPRDQTSNTLRPVPLWHTWWTGQMWQGPERLGGSLVTVHPTAVSWSESRYYDVFAIGFDHTLQHWWSDTRGAGGPDIGGPRSLGGDLQYVAPKAISWGPDRCDVFALGNDGALQHWWLTWRDWVQTGDDEYSGGTHEVHGPESLGGSFYSEPAVVSWGPNRIDIFATDRSQMLQHKWWDGVRWSGWEPLWSLPDPVTAVSWGSNRIDLFAIGSTPGTSAQHLWHGWWGGSAWGGPESLGAWSISRPAAVCWGLNRIDVFGRQWGSYMYHTWWDGLPSGGAMPTTMTSPPADPNARVRFDFVLGRDDWQSFITPDPNNIFVAVVPPGTDPARAPHYRMSVGALGWTASVPASAGGPGMWRFQCHVRGVDALGNDTGDIWSPVYSWDWQFRSPAAFFTLNSMGTGHFYAENWSARVLNS